MEKEIQFAWERANGEQRGGKQEENSRKSVNPKIPIANEDSLCQICNNGDSWDDNLIVFCAVNSLTPQGRAGPKKKKFYIKKKIRKYLFLTFLSTEMQRICPPVMLRSLKSARGGLDLPALPAVRPKRIVHALRSLQPCKLFFFFFSLLIGSLL